MDRQRDALHFPRPALAAQILDGFERGLSYAATIFAPRRKGKTQFLQFDLIPEARERGYLVAYCDLWSDKDHPEGVIASALAEAIGDAGLLRRVRARMFMPRRRLKKIELRAGVDGAGTGVEFEHAPDIMLDELFDQFKRLAGGRGLLVIDEIQYLASRRSFENLTAKLRSLLDRSRGEVWSVFTGSSQGGLTALFGRTKAPFFQFSSRVEFPNLGVELVQHFAERFHEITGGAWPVREVLDLYRRRGQSPLYLRSLLERCILAQESPDDADRFVWSGMVDQVGYPALLEELSPLERLVLRQILLKKPLYSEESLEEMNERLGSPVDVPRVQTALRRLEGARLSLVGRVGHAEPRIEDDMFRAWLMEMEKPESGDHQR